MAGSAVQSTPGASGLTLAARAFTPTSDPYRNLISVLMVFTISRIHQNFSFLTRFHPALLLVAGAAAYAWMNPRFLNMLDAPKTPAFRRITAMGIMACLSVPFGISIGGSGQFIISEYSKTLLFAFLVLLGVRHARDLYKFVWAFAISGGCLAYLGVFVFRMQTAKNDDFSRIQNGYSYDSNDIGLVCAIALVFALLVYQVTNKKGKTSCLVILAGLGMTIGRTGSRGAFLSLGVVIAGLMFLLPGVSFGKKLGFVIITFLGLLVAAPPGYWDQMLTITEPTKDYNWTSETGRKAVALRGLSYAARNPITGIGIANFPKAEGILSERAQAQALDQSLAGIKWSAAHNSYVQAVSEMGYPGLLLFLSLVLGSAWECRKMARKMPKHWVIGDQEQRFLYFTAIYLPVALLGFAVGCALVSFAYLDPIYVMVALVGGLKISIDQRLKDEAAKADGPASSPGQPVVWPRRYRGGLPPIGISTQPLPPPVMR